MDYRTALKAIKLNKVEPVYVCYGSEAYLLQQFIQTVTRQLIAPDMLNLGLFIFDLSEIDVGLIVEEAEIMPFMVPHKLIIAKNASMFTGAKDSGKVEHSIDRLTAYLRSSVDYSTIIFTVEADKLDERKKIVKDLKAKGALIPFAAMAPEDINSWVLSRADQWKVIFEKGAVEQLILYTGGQLQLIITELEKLSLYVGSGGQIDVALIDRMVSRSTEQNVFILIEYIAKLQMDRAFQVWDDLLKQKEEPIKILMLIARQFRIIWQVKELEKQGFSSQQIAGQISVHPYAAKLASEQGRRFDIPKLSGIMDQLAVLDYEMKSGRMDKVLGIELFLLRLAG